MTIAPAGTRWRIITVERHDGTIANGEPTYETEADWDSLKALYKVPAAYQGVSGGEVVRGLQMEANATGLFRVLSTPRTRSIKPRMRILMDERKMNIISVVDRDGANRELYIQVQELADS